MKTIIIEDNTAARESLKRLLNTHCNNISIIGEASNVEEATNLINSLKPNLIFLDVELPDGNGFDLLLNMKSIDFQVIFISSFKQYALKAIKFSALDYLLKPFDIDELKQAVQKAKQEIDIHETPKKIKTLTHNINQKSSIPDKLILKDKYGIQILTVNEIYHLQANGSYTEFYLKDKSPLIASKSLKEYQKLLSDSTFFRCHQSHIINLNHLSRYDKREGDFLILNNGNKVPLATRKRDSFFKIIAI
ncbi:LytR/AlgR family response regulator transcription factor [Tenacibaculum xiamenense]|uniref:LytR/AlgR family response regulator transcription factor n=1 Tax=Tenacibaculum xiamenense TaxID=1261553 RepID=UPI003893076A